MKFAMAVDFSRFTRNRPNSSYVSVMTEVDLRVRGRCNYAGRRVPPAAIGIACPALRTLPSMSLPRLSPTAFRRLTVVNVVLLVAIIVSGAIVRLTNSGLGCANWPNCSATKLVDVSTHHAAIEQLNRIFSGAIGVPIALALLGAYRRAPRRRDLIVPAWILFGLFWAEAVLGGIAVEVKLAWVSVMGHFLL